MKKFLCPFILGILICLGRSDRNFNTSSGNENVTSGTCRGAADNKLSTSIDNLAKVVGETQRSMMQSQNYQSARTGKSLYLGSNTTGSDLPTISEEVDGLKSLVSQLQSGTTFLSHDQSDYIFINFPQW